MADDFWEKKKVAKHKEVKTGWSNSQWNRKVWQNILRKAMAQEGMFCNDDDSTA
jgi:hypothetical protein